MLIPSYSGGKKILPRWTKKTTTDKLDPFMCPFNKIHLHSYLTILFKTKCEQLPHAKHSLHSRLNNHPHTWTLKLGKDNEGF